MVKKSMCFVDYEKAFDRVDWKKLMNALRKKGVDWKERRLIGNLYMGQRIKIKFTKSYRFVVFVCMAVDRKRLWECGFFIEVYQKQALA